MTRRPCLVAIMASVLVLSTLASGEDPTASASASLSLGHRDRLEHAFEMFHNYTNDAIEPVLTSDYMLFLAFLLTIQWHVRYHFQSAECVKKLHGYIGSPSIIYRKIALNIWIVQFYFDPKIPCDIEIKPRPFVVSVLLVLFDNFVLYHTMEAISRRFLRGSPRTRELQDPRRQGDVSTDVAESDMVTSKYQDLTYPVRRLFPIFVIQCALAMFYVQNLNNNADTHQKRNVKWWYWLIGVLIQLYAGERQLGEPYSKRYWDTLGAEHPELQDVQHEVLGVPGCCRPSYGKVWDFRNFMDFCVNGACRLIIMYTFPIMLCVEEPLDFVKDCTAVFFMTTLDDIDPSEYAHAKEIMIHLKFNIYYERIMRTINGREHQHTKLILLDWHELKFCKANKDKFDRQANYQIQLPNEKLSPFEKLLEETEKAAKHVEASPTRKNHPGFFRFHLFLLAFGWLAAVWLLNFCWLAANWQLIAGVLTVIWAAVGAFLLLDYTLDLGLVREERPAMYRIELQVPLASESRAAGVS